MTFWRFALCLVSSAAASLAHAAILAPGSPMTFPDTFNSITAHLFYDSGALPFSFDNGRISGVYEEFVGNDLNNVFCTGCLDFFLFVNVNATSTFSLNTIRFGMWSTSVLTDVGYSPPITPGIIPDTVFRGSANNIGFNFTGLHPGTGSAALIVETNSLTYGSGGIFFNDSNTGAGGNPGVISPVFGSIYTVPSPEPSSLALAGIGLLALGGSCLRSILVEVTEPLASVRSRGPRRLCSGSETLTPARTRGLKARQ